MNIHNDTRTFRLEIEETSGFYFVIIFIKRSKIKEKLEMLLFELRKYKKSYLTMLTKCAETSP